MIEQELTARLREVGREALKAELQKADVDADAVLIDGIPHRRVLRGTETYMTTLGPVTVERTLYKDRTDPDTKAVAALEARLGIIGGFWMPSAAKQATWVVSQMTPGVSEELFVRVGSMQPSKSSLDRLPKKIHGRWEEDREAFEAELRTVTEIPEETRSIAVSIDGVLAPMKEGGAKETRARAAAADGHDWGAIPRCWGSVRSRSARGVVEDFRDDRFPLEPSSAIMQGKPMLQGGRDQLASEGQWNVIRLPIPDRFALDLRWKASDSLEASAIGFAPLGTM